MDKLNRVTRWEELEIGARYEWVKGRTRADSLMVHCYTLREVNKEEGFILMQPEGSEDMVHFYAWQSRFRRKLDL